MFTAEVIAIGDELTNGERLDTNSQWLSQRLGELGVAVNYHSTTGDQLVAQIEVFRRAIQRADIVVTTGGLGPTADDLTRIALSEATARPLEFRNDSWQHIQKLFAKRQRPVPEQNRRQAMFPMGSHMIANPHGTAPGIDLMYPRAGRPAARFFCLPGVPAEMVEMWQAHVVPAIQRLHGKQQRMIRRHCIKCFGVGESDLEAMLPDIIARDRDPQVGITVHKATITLRISADGDSEESCQQKMQPTIDLIHEKLGTLVFGENQEELHHVVARQLAERRATLATAECGTDGILARWLGELGDHRDQFLGGWLVRSAEVARRLLPTHQPKTTLEESLQDLAARVRGQFGADYALVVGPTPDEHGRTGFPTPQHPPGHIALALATPSTAVLETKPFGGHPDIVKERAAKMALNLLRLQLLSQD